LSNRIRLALIDEHLLFRQVLSMVLARTDVDVVGSVGTVAELRTTPGWGASVVVLEPGPSSAEQLHTDICALVAAGSMVIVVSGRTDPGMVAAAARAGSTAHLSKAARMEDLLAAIRGTAGVSTFMSRELAGALLADFPVTRPQLSPQERRTLSWYAGGMPMKSVALRLGVTEGAVKSYVDRIREKYEKAGRDAPTKVDLYKRAVEDGYLTAT